MLQFKIVQILYMLYNFGCTRRSVYVVDTECFNQLHFIAYKRVGYTVSLWSKMVTNVFMHHRRVPRPIRSRLGHFDVEAVWHGVCEQECFFNFVKPFVPVGPEREKPVLVVPDEDAKVTVEGHCEDVSGVEEVSQKGEDAFGRADVGVELWHAACFPSERAAPEPHVPQSRRLDVFQELCEGVVSFWVESHAGVECFKVFRVGDVWRVLSVELLQVEHDGESASFGLALVHCANACEVWVVVCALRAFGPRLFAELSIRVHVCSVLRVRKYVECVLFGVWFDLARHLVAFRAGHEHECLVFLTFVEDDDAGFVFGDFDEWFEFEVCVQVSFDVVVVGFCVHGPAVFGFAEHVFGPSRVINRRGSFVKC